jgi:hypothetical protein
MPTPLDVTVRRLAADAAEVGNPTIGAGSLEAEV